jgi:hypothetical protein
VVDFSSLEKMVDFSFNYSESGTRKLGIATLQEHGLGAKPCDLMPSTAEDEMLEDKQGSQSRL